jgi:hypothetical protein
MGKPAAGDRQIVKSKAGLGFALAFKVTNRYVPEIPSVFEVK